MLEPGQVQAADKDKPISFSERLKIPPELPGADAAPIALPPFDPDRPTARASAIAELFPELEQLTADVALPDGAPSPTLAELESLALQSHPTVTQAAADINAATGEAIQAGMYPNPSIGYEADTVGSGGTRNYQGVFLTQKIKTAGKLDLARAAANVDLMNSQLAYRRSRAEVLSRVRARYFGVLVASESLTAAEALARFSNEVYRVQVEQLEGGQAAAYEPMQLRALTVQSRAAMIQARNRYIAEWKQLAAAVGVPELPVSRLSDRAGAIGPAADYDAALAYLVNYHTDVVAARNTEHREQLKLRLAEVAPIPDVEVYAALQKDFTTPPVTRTTYNLQVGVPVPLFDRNRGGIRSAQAALVRAAEESHRVQLDLTGRLADVFARYESARTQLAFYRDQILPDQARAYRGVYERHQQEPDQVGFGDVVVAQQNLQAAVSGYIASLESQWQTYVELAALLQLEDLSQFPAAGTAIQEPVPVPAERNPNS
jgi:outer membrane protein, heavy metal efflux system